MLSQEEADVAEAIRLSLLDVEVAKANTDTGTRNPCSQGACCAKDADSEVVHRNSDEGGQASTSGRAKTNDEAFDEAAAAARAVAARAATHVKTKAAAATLSALAAASSAAGAAREELQSSERFRRSGEKADCEVQELTVASCRVMIQVQAADADARHQHVQESAGSDDARSEEMRPSRHDHLLLVEGMMRLTPLPLNPITLDSQDGASRQLLLTVTATSEPCGSSALLDEFTMLCDADMRFFASSPTQLLFMLPRNAVEHLPSNLAGALLSDDSNLPCALHGDAASLAAVAALLLRCRYQVRRKAHAEAEWAARGIQGSGAAVASGIRRAASAAAWGVRSAGAVAARRSSAAGGYAGGTPDGVEVPRELSAAASMSRSATRAAARGTGSLVRGLSSAVGWAACAVHDQLPNATETWHEDVKTVGKSSLGAGAQVWQALQDASAEFWGDVAETSAGLVRHRYGEEAGSVARDGLHAVGNVFEAQANISVRAVAPVLGAGVANSLAHKQEPQEPPAPMPSLPSAPRKAQGAAAAEDTSS
eukprot:TRINITY_DN54777_c0_g1_i1.p1 TRINITY_DN54777_c0_g1~~TRINITY_DN54777_c0_g1_i1.p1  ORF type:complete len:538 (+),score=129.02 TRINITY_DN54777_c0_g1_i1:215-1828(+)